MDRAQEKQSIYIFAFKTPWKNICLNITFVILLFWSTGIHIGCGDNEFIRPENAHNYRNKNIIVTLRTGAKVSFEHDQYSFGQTSKGKYLSGIGLTIAELDTSLSVREERTIYFDEIDTIRNIGESGNIEKRVNAIMVAGVAVASAVLIFYLFLGFNHH